MLSIPTAVLVWVQLDDSVVDDLLIDYSVGKFTIKFSFSLNCCCKTGVLVNLSL